MNSTSPAGATMDTTVFDKTLKGRCEIATRENGLSPRLRTLLLLVNGSRTATELLRLVEGFGISERHLEHLRTYGYIRDARRLGRAQPQMQREADPLFRALYDFYSDTIRRHIGLRGYTLQLRVEQAEDITALADLRAPYLEALLQAKGNDLARMLQRRLDGLLAQAELSATA